MLWVYALKPPENRALIVKDAWARSHDSLYNNDKWLKPSAKVHHVTSTFRFFFAQDGNMQLRLPAKIEQEINVLRTTTFSKNRIFNFLSHIHNRDKDIFWRLDQRTAWRTALFAFGCFFHNPPTTANNNNGAGSKMPRGLWWKTRRVELQSFLTASMSMKAQNKLCVIAAQQHSLPTLL